MSWTNYRIKEDITLAISSDVIEKLYKYKQVNKSDNEAGGILLGRIKYDYSKYELIDISEPCNRDKRSRFSFIRNKNKAQKIINKAFKDSDGVVQYMGEWHTHPEVHPTPSSVDIKLITDCTVQENIPNIIFLIIVGYEGNLYVGCSQEGSKLRKLHKINKGDL